MKNRSTGGSQPHPDQPDLAAEVKHLEKVNHDLNAIRVGTADSFCGEWMDLTARIHRIRARITALGLDPDNAMRLYLARSGVGRE